MPPLIATILQLAATLLLSTKGSALLSTNVGQEVITAATQAVQLAEESMPVNQATSLLTPALISSPASTSTFNYSQPFINTVDPNEGSATGTVATITGWGFGATDTIELNGLVVATTTPINNSSTLNFRVPDSLALGAYQLTVFTNAGLRSNAAPFSIVSWIPTSTIDIISPAGGEVWPIGTSQTIRWISPPHIPQVNISLERAGTCPWQASGMGCQAENTFLVTYPERPASNTGSFSWVVGSGSNGSAQNASTSIRLPPGTYFLVLNGVVPNDASYELENNAVNVPSGYSNSFTVVASSSAVGAQGSSSD